MAKTDIEIAHEVTPLPITEVAQNAGLSPDLLDLYGNTKAKINVAALKDKPARGKLILVTAINPTPAGEGKTTTSVGLADALAAEGHKTMLCLREPSLGPVFGMKGGAAGGGYAQVIPMEDINLHFTGDFHAIGAANNLCAAMLDNHIKQGNLCNIDPRRIVWKRCVDMNDRQLRHVVDGLGGVANGVPREDGFDITVASEVMACLCLASDIADLKARLARMVVAYTYDREPVTVADIQAQGALCALLVDALKPNLVQTLEHTPALVHGGPFANIAHGCNSLQATLTALKLADYVVTEAGFGADLGAEKFVDIVCRQAQIAPNAVVLVATIRALKYNAGVAKTDLGRENCVALEAGLPNLERHVHNIQQVFGLPVVVALNVFASDTPAEIATLTQLCQQRGIELVTCEAWAQGNAGARELARSVVALCDKRDATSSGAVAAATSDTAATPSAHLRYAYNLDESIEQKIIDLATKVYHADGVTFTPVAQKQLKQLTDQGFASLPICMAKTQYSFSDDPTALGAPDNFTITVRQLKPAAGAGFIVVYTGDIMTMPGLPKVPAAINIDVTDDGTITGLF